MSKAGKKLHKVAKDRKKEKELGLTDEAKREIHRTCGNVKASLDELFAAVEAVPKAFGDKHQRKSIAGAAFTLSELLGVVQWWYPPPKVPGAVLGVPKPTADSPERINVKGGDPVFPDGSSAKVVQCPGWGPIAGCGKLSEPGKNFCAAHKEKPPESSDHGGSTEVKAGLGKIQLPSKDASQGAKADNAKDNPASNLNTEGDSTPDAAWTGIAKGV